MSARAVDATAKAAATA